MTPVRRRDRDSRDGAVSRPLHLHRTNASEVAPSFGRLRQRWGDCGRHSSVQSLFPLPMISQYESVSYPADILRTASMALAMLGASLIKTESGLDGLFGTVKRRDSSYEVRGHGLRIWLQRLYMRILKSTRLTVTS